MNRPDDDAPRFSRAVDRLGDAVGSAVSWLTVVMVLVTAANAVARYAGRAAGRSLSSNAWIELPWMLYTVVFLLGAAATLRANRHVRVDALIGRLSPRARALIELLGGILFLLPFCTVTALLALPAVRNSWNIHEGSPDPGGLPRYPVKAVLLLGLALLFVQGLSEIVKAARALRAGTR
jgi:TRAP-type mannitol/chloroaromatic compound transport system permease small subunit